MKICLKQSELIFPLLLSDIKKHRSPGLIVDEVKFSFAGRKLYYFIFTLTRLNLCNGLV